MQLQLTTDIINELAPDAASLKGANGLATARSWESVGRNDEALWGECKGSGKEPYRAQVDLRGLGYRCTCPSRKFPCKHCLALMLLAVQSDVVHVAEPPAWVSEWLANRIRAANRAAEGKKAAPGADKTATNDAEKASRRVTAREARVAAGLEDLERWLYDSVHHGLASLQAGAPTVFDAFAARMVDAQAPGVARLLRLAGGVATSGSGWQERLLAALARIYLLARAYRKLAALPPELQADVRAVLGFTLNQEEVLVGAGISDRWLVLGRVVVEEERGRTQRSWLWGEHCQRAALLLDFSFAGQPFDRSLVPGQTLDAELVFFPGSTPVRALIRQCHAISSFPPQLPPHDLRAATATYAAALAANPWLERTLLTAGPCTLLEHDGGWYIRDDGGCALPLSPHFDAWQLLAITGGRPFHFAAEWDGSVLVLLYAQQGQQGWTLNER
jgi:hypothetical protein